MKQHQQIRLMKHMLTMIDNDSTEGAGQVVKNPTASYVCKDLAQQEWEHFFADHPQAIGLSANLAETRPFMTNRAGKHKKGPMFLFDAFHLDVANASLRSGEQTIPLTPKAFATLQHLVEHAGDLVTKDELWRAVWPSVIVTDAALTVCVSEIRKALGDSAKTPQYVETVHRRGYRFIAPVKTQRVQRVGLRDTQEVRLRDTQDNFVVQPIFSR